MNLHLITASRPRALLLVSPRDCSSDWGAVEGVVAVADSVNPGQETSPASESDKGGLMHRPGALDPNSAALRVAI